PFPRRVGDAPAAADRVGDRARGDAGKACDIIPGGHPAHLPATLARPRRTGGSLAEAGAGTGASAKGYGVSPVANSASRTARSPAIESVGSSGPILPQASRARLRAGPLIVISGASAGAPVRQRKPPMSGSNRTRDTGGPIRPSRSWRGC